MWRQAYAEQGDAGLINASPIPKWHANRTPLEREEKVLYLRFALSTADVEELLAERGVIVSREAIRLWVKRFGALKLDQIAPDLLPEPG